MQDVKNGSESNEAKRCHLFEIQAAIKATKKEFNYLPNVTNCINDVEMDFGCGMTMKIQNGKMK